MSSHVGPYFGQASLLQGPAAHQRKFVNIYIRQEPHNARVASGSHKDQKPLDPPAIVQLIVNNEADAVNNYLLNPYYFMKCCVIPDDDHGVDVALQLQGTTISSLHRLKDLQNKEGAFFVFSDLMIKYEGAFRLRFDLYELRDHVDIQNHDNNGAAHFYATATTGKFWVKSPKDYIALETSTDLTKKFNEQGVRLRLKKKTKLNARRPGGPQLDPNATNIHAMPNAHPESQNASRDDEVQNRANESAKGHVEPAVAAMAFPDAHQFNNPSYGRTNQNFPGFENTDEHGAKRTRTNTGVVYAQPHSPASMVTDQQHWIPDQAQQHQHIPPWQGTEQPISMSMEGMRAAQHPPPNPYQQQSYVYPQSDSRGPSYQSMRPYQLAPGYNPDQVLSPHPSYLATQQQHRVSYGQRPSADHFSPSSETAYPLHFSHTGRVVGPNIDPALARQPGSLTESSGIADMSYQSSYSEGPQTEGSSSTSHELMNQQFLGSRYQQPGSNYPQE